MKDLTAAEIGGLADTSESCSPVSHRYTRLARLTIPPGAMLVVALAGISNASFWRDEAATLSAVRRPLPALWHFFGATDVVHAVYYLLMLPVSRQLGTNAFDMRLPSAVAVACAAAGVAALAARLASERAGLAAGLMFVVFPVTSRYGQEARSYAMVMAFGVFSTYLLCRAVTSGSNERRWWIGYAVAAAAIGWMNLLGLLIIPAHGLTIASRTHWRITSLAREWLFSALASALAVAPLIILAWPQRHGTQRFLADTSFLAVAEMPDRFTGSWEVLPFALALAVIAVRTRWGDSKIVPFCLPWLVLPPLVLLSVGAASPIYDPRYILFCVPALTILAGVGLDIVVMRMRVWFAGRRQQARDNSVLRHTALPPVLRRPALGVVAGIIFIGIVGLPSQITYRSADGHGDNIRLAAQIVARNEMPGDAVLYQPPWWRQIAAAYPYGFNRLRDISLAKTPAQAGNFTGTQLPVPETRNKLRGVTRVWLVEFMRFQPDPMLRFDWVAVMHWRIGSFVLVLYARGK